MLLNLPSIKFLCSKLVKLLIHKNVIDDIRSISLQTVLFDYISLHLVARLLFRNLGAFVSQFLSNWI